MDQKEMSAIEEKIREAFVAALESPHDVLAREYALLSVISERRNNILLEYEKMLKDVFDTLDNRVGCCRFHRHFVKV